MFPYLIHILLCYTMAAAMACPLGFEYAATNPAASVAMAALASATAAVSAAAMAAACSRFNPPFLATGKNVRECVEATGMDEVGIEWKLVTLMLVQALRHSEDRMHDSS